MPWHSYKNFIQSGSYNKHRHGTNNKTEIWTKKELMATTIQNMTTDNFAAIRLEGLERVYVTSLYDEPEGHANQIPHELEQTLNNRVKRHILAGDAGELKIPIEGAKTY